MAGHSKWANIKHRKAAQDAKRGKVFTKLIREIVIAAKQGGPLPEDNPRLRIAVDKALAANMTKDTIERATARGAGTNDADNMEEVTYEGYGNDGVAILVETLTDNRNRTVADVRHAFSKAGGNLGTDGSVAYLFNRIGLFCFSQTTDEEQLMEIALEAGAEDVRTNSDGSFDVITAFTDFFEVKKAIDTSVLKPESAEITMEATINVSLEKEAAEKLLNLIDALEDLDDVQNVYSNADFSDEVMAQLNGE